MYDLITQISLTKDEERKINIPRYESLFCDGSYYNKLIDEERKRLFEERKQYETDMEFYKSVAKKFARKFIAQMIQDFGKDIEPSIMAKLSDIMTGANLSILEPGEAVKTGLIATNDKGKPMGDEGAFAISERGMVCFTPEAESSKQDLSKKTPEEKLAIVIQNALLMESSMIHEVFHIMINTMLNEKFAWYENGSLQERFTSGGFILNEGLVEKYATEFSLLHGFVHNPALDYFHYIDLCNEIENVLGKEELMSLALHGDYKKILSSCMSPNEIDIYELNERKKYLERLGSTYDSILTSGEQPIEFITL